MHPGTHVFLLGPFASSVAITRTIIALNNAGRTNTDATTPSAKIATNVCSVGEIFPLQGTLCQKLQEDLARFFSGASDRDASAPPPPPLPPPPGQDVSNRDSNGNTNIHGESSRDGGGAAAAEAQAAALGMDRAKKAAGGRGAVRDRSAIRIAIETVRESTGVSAELASYALLASKVRHKKVVLYGIGLRFVVPSLGRRGAYPGGGRAGRAQVYRSLCAAKVSSSIALQANDVWVLM